VFLPESFISKYFRESYDWNQEIRGRT
jgi:hypothetical protein